VAFCGGGRGPVSGMGGYLRMDVTVRAALGWVVFLAQRPPREDRPYGLGDLLIAFRHIA